MVTFTILGYRPTVGRSRPSAAAIGHRSPNPSANPLGGQGKKESVPVAAARGLAWSLRTRSLPTRSLRTAAVRVLAAAGAVVMALVPVTSALADPLPSPGAIEAQITDLWNKSEPLIEEFNRVHGQLTAAKAHTAALEQQMRPLEDQIDAALAQVTAIAVRRYKQGPGSSVVNSLLTSGSPTELADQLSLLEAVAVGQRDKISAVTSARDKLAADKKAWEDLVAQQAKLDADAAARKKVIDDQLATLQQLRLKAYGTTNGTGYYRPVACPFVSVGGAADVAAQAACAQVGKPYVWAAAGPDSFDCSGLMKYGWGQAGVTLSHYTGTQYQETTRITRDQLRTGDLIFIYSDMHHVAMYMGGGWVLHAPSFGDVVRMANIDSVGPINGYGRPGG